MRTDGTVTCWGSSSSGQLGDGTFVPKTTPTTMVMGLVASPTTIALASSHGCALMPGGIGQCWGDNAHRQLGDGTTMDRSTATNVPVGDIAQLAPSGYSVSPYTGGSTCVLTTADTVSCWGSNDFGQLGNGNTSTTTTSTPVQVSNLTDAAEIVAGRYHVCVRRRNGEVSCWGRNDFGQIGDGTNNTRTSPYTVELPRPAVHIGAGGWHTCALLDDDSLSCWGANSSGQLGDGSTTTRTRPVTSPTTCQ
ncbi:MAG: RCC1 domain-containing protein [Kofleriaceae bacterium]